MGGSIICLQEVPRWTSGKVLKGEKYVVLSSRTKGDETANRDGFDCGFLIPASLNPKVRDEQYQKYWAGMVIAIGPSGHTIFLSMHLIHFNHFSRNPEDESGTDLIDELREGVITFVHKCRKQYGNHIGIIVGFDANVTLPANIEGITGDSLLAPLKSHSGIMQQRVLALLQALGVRVLNTFGRAGATINELWTCGLKRKLTANRRLII